MRGEDEKKRNKEKVLINYYKNRRKRLEYQRKYDKKNREKIRKYDRKKRKENTEKDNFMRRIRDYSRKNHYPKLLKKFKGCQICSKKKNLEIHHRKYTRRIEDCILLCKDCHKMLHRKYHNHLLQSSRDKPLLSGGICPQGERAD